MTMVVLNVHRSTSDICFALVIVSKDKKNMSDLPNGFVLLFGLLHAVIIEYWKI